MCTICAGSGGGHRPVPSHIPHQKKSQGDRSGGRSGRIIKKLSSCPSPWTLLTGRLRYVCFVSFKWGGALSCRKMTFSCSLSLRLFQQDLPKLLACEMMSDFFGYPVCIYSHSFYRRFRNKDSSIGIRTTGLYMTIRSYILYYTIYLSLEC